MDFANCPRSSSVDWEFLRSEIYDWSTKPRENQPLGNPGHQCVSVVPRDKCQESATAPPTKWLCYCVVLFGEQLCYFSENLRPNGQMKGYTTVCYFLVNSFATFSVTYAQTDC